MNRENPYVETVRKIFLVAARQNFFQNTIRPQTWYLLVRRWHNMY